MELGAPAHAAPFLRQVDFSDNRLSKGLAPLAACPNLRSIVLLNNKISDLEEVKALVRLSLSPRRGP
jgi:Leucine-rich repeat (LRR) protein